MRSRWGIAVLAAWTTGTLACGVLTAAARIDDGTPARVAGVTLRNPRSVPLASGVAGAAGPQTGTAGSEGAGRLSAVTRDEAATAADLAEAFPPGSLGRLFPAQYTARQIASDPASAYWALIVGINDYAAPTADTVGSRPDARELRDHLRSLGWRSDHILVLTDRDATASAVIEAIRWLASKTDARSTVVFHYAGHEKPYPGDVDADGERRDVALWAADNRLIVDSRLARELGKVRAQRMWLHFAACRAGGFDDPGMAKRGRVLTYSSPEDELSYEDPQVGHSVFGYYTIVEGMVQGLGDADRDGDVTVEEAFRHAEALVWDHTGNRQHPILVDGVAGQLSLVPPEPDRPQEPREEPGCGLPFCAA